MQKAVDPSGLKRAAPVGPPDAAASVRLAGEGGNTRSRRSLLRGAAQAVLMVAVLAAGVLAMNRIVASAPERAPRPFTPPVLTVEAVRPVATSATPRIEVFGEVVAARAVDIRPAVSGGIVSVSPRLQVGDIVQAGAEIARIDAFDYEGAVIEARANLAQTRSAIVEIEARIAAERDQLSSATEQLALAEDDLRRAEGLAAGGSLSGKALDERRLVVSQRQGALLQRRNNLAIETARLDQQQAQADRLAWKLRQAERALDDTVIRAPFTGIVQAASAQAGKRVGAQDVLASIYAPDALDIRFTITDAQYGRLLADAAPILGRAVEAEWRIGAEAHRFSGTVSRIGAQLASATGGAELFARIDTAALPEALATALRPGAFLSVSLPDRTYAGVLRLPETALTGTDTLHVIRDGALSPVKATVVAFDGADVLVAAEATAGESLAGEAILATRLSTIDPGQKVRIAGEAAAAPSPAPAPAP